ncbi:MAG: helix-turn-helix domain-containing protein [Planctomycetota bacterium]
MSDEKKSDLTVHQMVESIVGCKWSMAVLGSIRGGVVRPNAIERGHPGLSSKVLNERLNKLLRFGLVERTVYPETPPRVEYTLTELGREFGGLIDEVGRLQERLAGGAFENDIEAGADPEEAA